jgi:hypothetical protein
VRLIALTVAIPGDEVNPDLPLKLRAEGPGILARAVGGCLKRQSASANVCCWSMTSSRLADILRVIWHVSKVPIAENQIQADANPFCAKHMLA